MRLRLPWRKSPDATVVSSPVAGHSKARIGSSCRDLQVLYAKATALHESGRIWEAHRMLCDLHDRRFSASGFARKLAWSHLSTGRWQDAVALMREAVATEPHSWQSHYGLAEVERSRDPAAAKAVFLRALSIDPENEHCLLGLSACHLSLKEGPQAEAVARRLVEIEPHSYGAWVNLGSALLMQDRLADAHEAFLAAEQLGAETNGDHTDDLNRGIVLRLQGRNAEAIEYYEARLPEHPSVSAHAQYALTLLTMGRLTEGFDQYEFRWLDEPLVRERARYGRPFWNGQDLRGKTILVRSEQGAGDVVQFIRYAPHLKKLGATVLLELHLEMGILGKGFAGVDRVFRRGAPLPDFDFFIDLLSLPKAFGTTLAPIPAEIPYLQPPASWRTQWRDRLGRDSGLKVGLVWAGDPKHPRDRHRSVPFDLLGPLFQVAGVRWFSLQKGPAAEAASAADFKAEMTSLGSQLYEYADTAAAIENLDLVLTVDTSVAHLAGALGRSVWMLLPFVADWRWLEDRSTSPWYPTMRIFRQARPGDWPAVIERVARALAELAATASEPPSTTPLSVLTAVGASKSEAENAPLESRPTLRIARACHTRFGMMQFIPGPERLARCLEYYGDYLQNQLEIAKSLVRPGDVILDVAAGVGMHSIALAPCVGADGQVLAIEHSRILRRILKQNIEANEVQGISLMPPAALSESLDELALDRLDFVKVNDPSETAKVVEGGKDTLQRHAPILMFTEQPRDGLDPVAERLAGSGYACWKIESALFDPSNFNRRNDDLFDGERSYALLALPRERQIPDVVRAMAEVAPLRF